MIHSILTACQLWYGFNSELTEFDGVEIGVLVLDIKMFKTING